MIVPMEKLGNMVEILSGFPFDSKHFRDDEGVPLIRIRDVVRGSTATRYAGDYDPRFIINNEEVLIGMDGEFNVARWRGGPALLNQRVCRISSRNGRLDERYLYRFLPQALKKIEDATPYVTVKHLSTKDIREIQLPLPPLAEQKRIAAILDAAEALREKRRQAIELVRTHELAVLLKTLKNGALKRVSLASLAVSSKNSFANGPFGSDLLTSELIDQGVPVIYIRDVRDGVYRRRSTACVSARKATQLNYCRVASGDVLIAKVGDPPGTAAIYPSEEPNGIVTQDVVRLQVDRTIASPEYLVAYLNSPVGRSQVSTVTVRGTRARFSLGDFKRLEVELPPLDRQIEFARVGDALTIITESMRTSLTQIVDLGTSLQHRAFRGEL
jgi:type I restriction enzyme, S subunit